MGEIRDLAAAGVQAPTIYRQFGDMRGLLDEVASFGFSRYVRYKTSQERVESPVEDLRRGWDPHVVFGLENPAFYAPMNGDPGPAWSPPQPGRRPRSCTGSCSASTWRAPRA